MLATCDVHRIVYHDSGPREVEHCNLCNADLCADCRSRLDLRTVAAVKALPEKLRKILEAA